MFDFSKYINYIPLILAGFAITALITPFIIKLALKFGVYDKPKNEVSNELRGSDTILHNQRMPRMGFVAVIIPLFLIAPFFIPITFKIVVIGFTILILAILGILDDKYKLSSAPQFLVQIICIIIVILCGVSIDEANNPFTGSFINFDRGHFIFNLFGHSASLTLLSIIVTFIWIIFITNAINWSDGVDGVLNGTVAISLLIILLVSIRNDSPFSAIIAAIFLGANLGFLPYNFAPARIINGYGGTIYGYIIGILAILGQVKLSIALLAIIIPVIDVIWVISHRIKVYKPKSIKAFAKAVTTPGKVHFHHRLMDAGLSIRKVALTEYVLAAATGLVAILLSGLELTFLVISSVLGVLLIFIILDKIRQRKVIKEKKQCLIISIKKKTE